ncbi:MAG: 50S ribosomal protein L21 [Chloroflexota bacterium]
MYAVIETGGKQYRVEVGTELEVELLDVEPGKTITIDRVLLVADGDESTIGRPLVADASVSAEVVNQTRGPKLISFKYRPKARSRVKKGHRQDLTVLRIADITLGDKSAASSARESEDQARTERMRVEEAAAAQAAKDAELAAKLAVGAEEKPVKAAKPKPAPKAKAETVTEVQAEPDSETTEATAPATSMAAKADADAASGAPAKKAAPKKPAAKAETVGDEAPAAAPKKTRATKKDE